MLLREIGYISQVDRNSDLAMLERERRARRPQSGAIESYVLFLAAYRFF